MSKVFTNIEIHPDYSNGHIITWAIDPTINIGKEHTFILQSSGSVGFEEILTESNIGNAFFAKDITNLKQSFNADIYYRVVLKDLDKENSYTSDPVVFIPKKYDRRAWVYAREIARKEILRNKLIGNIHALIKRKIYGQEFNDSVDPVTGVPLTDSANSQGTQYVTAYYDPLIILASMEDTAQTRRLASDGFGVMDVEQATFRTVGFPIIETYDIIVDVIADKRYIVKEVEKISYPAGNIVMIQILKTQAIPVTDPIYNIVVPHVQL